AGADYTPIGRFTKEDATKYWSPRVMYYQYVALGVDLETAIIEAQKLRTLVGEDRASALNNLANFIRDVLESKRRRSMFGSSLASICYVITKWLEVINGFGQLYMLACFVGEGDYLWGIHVGFADLLHTVLNGTDNPNAGIFPRIVLCDVTKFVRKMGFSKRLEAAGDPQPSPVNNNKQHATAQPMPRTRALSVGNLETEVPTAPMESSPLISEGSTQAVDDVNFPIQSLRASPGSNRRRLANIYPGVDLVDNHLSK
ncbi:hypothetical protein TELCIR_05411, partial [Teladorsagia circumcincta]